MPEAKKTEAAKPIDINLLTEENLKGSTAAELEELYNYMNGLRAVLIMRMELVAKVKASKEALESAKAEADKMPPEKRAALAQVLLGDHVKKDAPEVNKAESTKPSVP